jgi:hypothetical protein
VAGIRRVTLSKDDLTLPVFGYAASAIALARNASGSNLDFGFLAVSEIPVPNQHPPDCIIAKSAVRREPLSWGRASRNGQP